MSRGEAWFMHASAAAVCGTGAVLTAMVYAMEPADEFALVNHPAQPDFLHAHVLLAPLFVFALGLVWLGHVWVRVRSGWQPRRRTGLALAALVWPMVASGYLLQVVGDPGVRDALLIAHVVTSLGFLALYPLHLLARRSARAAAASG